MSELTRILTQIESGDPTAAEQLLPLVYDELRKLAAVRLAKEHLGQTLQATALVHEAYLRLVGQGERQPSWDNRQFGQVKLLLDLQSPAAGDTDDRGWEWHFWRRRLEQGQVQIGKPTSPVDNARVSMDTQFSGHGSRLVSLEYSKPHETPALHYPSWLVTRALHPMPKGCK